MNSYLNIHELFFIEKTHQIKLLSIYKIKSFSLFLLKSNINKSLLHQISIFNCIFKTSFNKFKNTKTTRTLHRFKIYKMNEQTPFLKKNNWWETSITMYFKNTYIIYILYNKINRQLCNVLIYYSNYSLFFKKSSVVFLNIYKRTTGEGFFYIRGLFLVFFIDASITDDEPLWEPIEWSLVQTWILFIFIFAWIAENLIVSRYGSFTGRDKRVWFAWYKSFWLIELSYIISYVLAALLVIVPFYYELTYSLSFAFSWWNWYTRVFFFKFISIYSIILIFAHLLQINLRWLNWKKLLISVLLINFFLAYLLYTHFIMTFFGYFTDPTWYQKTRFVDYIQLSHEPLKWGWGSAKRDHFTYHKVTTTFWFKNDGPFAGAFLMFHLFFFLSVFFIYLYWLVLLRKIYVTREITFTFTTFCVSALKQFYYFFFLIYVLVFMSFIVCYWRFPIEFLWISNSNSWVWNFFKIIADYPLFLVSLF